MKMFKLGSFEEELVKNMEKSLFSSQLENQYSFDKIAKAADYINSAAELLDDTGFSTEAKVLTKVIERLAAEETVELSDEEIDEILQGKKNDVKDLSIEEIISDSLDPLEQEIIIEVVPSSMPKIKPYEGKTPLVVNHKNDSIEVEPEYVFASLNIDKLAKKYSDKKKD